MITLLVGFAAGCVFFNFYGESIKDAYNDWRNG